MCYHIKNGELQCKPLCVISDDMEHDTPFVYEVQAEVGKFLEKELPHIREVEYFSDG